MNNRLAIITICLNDREGLQHTLNSIFGQTVKDFDLIVVDGMSSDGSVELLERNADRITSWISERDQGIYDAQNKGWRMATTPYIQFLNAGDVFASDDVLERVIPLLSENVDIAYGDALLTDANGDQGMKKHPAKLSSPYLMRETVAHQAQFIRRSFMEAFGGYDTRYRIAGDYDLLARAFWKHKTNWMHLPFPICIFNTEGMSSMTANRSLVASERKAIQSRLSPRFWYLIYHTWAAINRSIGR